MTFGIASNICPEINATESSKVPNIYLIYSYNLRIFIIFIYILIQVAETKKIM
jgi:hypothetical protein